MKRVLITGAGGLLGREMCSVLDDAKRVLISRELLAADRYDQLEKTMAEYRPHIVVNCAAHTNVEQAEVNPAVDYEANALLPERLSRLCGEFASLLVHISSTGCYGDWKSTPFTEEDEVRPTTVHHKSKAAGEEFVRSSGCRHLIVRTGWLFGGLPGAAKNFVWRRMVDARNTREMLSDATQFGCPTYAVDVAAQVQLMIEQDLTGTFNVVSQGKASRYEYVREIMTAAGIHCEVRPGPAFKRLAPVSFNETALNVRLQSLGCDRMPDWRESLSRYIQSTASF